MTRTRILAASLVALLGVTACEGFKEAMTAHVDVVARAGSQELTVKRLSELLGPTDVPLRADAIRTVAQLWVNYQLLAQAGAAGDTLATPADADAGMWSAIAQLRTRKFYEGIAATWPAADPSTFEKAYNEGKLLAAAHILLSKQPEGLVAGVNDSIKKEAEKIAATVTAATFASVAKARSQDPGSKDKGGDYGVFAPGQMVPEFDAGILSVPPGGISKVVETQFGYHIIRRHTYDEIKDQFAQQYPEIANVVAESTYFAKLEKDANVEVKPGAARLVKAIAEDVDAYRTDKTVIATARSGNLDAGRMSKWMAAFPPQSRMRANVVQAPDSLIPMFVQNVMRNELLLRAADEAKVDLDSAQMTELRTAFYGGVMNAMSRLNIAPSQLADSGADLAARQRLASSRIEEYMGGMVTNQREYVDVAEQIVLVLRDKYESRIVPAGIDRVLAEATKVRAAADSARAANQPPTAVPMMTPPAAAPTTPQQP
jgi:peptidyl-prolyl cis-trans isomerase D